MKFTVQTDKPSNGRTFGPGETVRGLVELPADSDAGRVPDVAVVFQGTVRLSIIPQTSMDAVAQVPNAASQRTHTYTLFSYTVTATPKASTTANGHIVYTAPFSFRFPAGDASGCCSSDSACALPPSVDLNTAKIHARVVYSVTASARRMKHGGLQLLPSSWRRQMRARQVLAFAPGLPIDGVPAEPSDSDSASISTASTQPSSPSSSPPPPAFSRPALVCTNSLLPYSLYNPKIDLLEEAATTTIPDSLPPPYSPAMVLELVMPQPAVIAPGAGGIALGVFLRTPQDLLQSGGAATLRSVRVQLRLETAARIGTAVARAAPMSWPLWSIQGAIPLQHEQLDITEACGGVWASQCCVPASVRPSFRSCFLSQAYSIEVEVGVSSTPVSSDIKYMHASIDVVVSEPPPKYNDELAVQLDQSSMAANLEDGMGRPLGWSSPSVEGVRV